jgi:hypothetical protein
MVVPLMTVQPEERPDRMQIMSSFLAGALLAAAAAAPAAAGGDPLSPLQWKKRALLVFAPDAQNDALLRQRQLFRADPRGTQERDFVLIEAVGGAPASETLRRRFGVSPLEFRAILVGKDGGGKLSSRAPIGLERLYREIDAMPMRRQEP